jgi:hypothetical protein
MCPKKDELTLSIKRLERAHSELIKPPPVNADDTASRSPKRVQNHSQYNFHHHHNIRTNEIENEYEDEAETRPPPPPPPQTRLAKKAPSIRSKGFSIPLNASYCLNSIPITCIHHHQHCMMHPQHQQQQHQQNLNNHHLHHHHNEPILTRTSIIVATPSVTKQQTLAVKSPTTTTTTMSDIELFKDYDEIKAQESLLFQKRHFDLEEENSCLKEVNMRLRFAQVKNVTANDTNNSSIINDDENNYNNVTFRHLSIVSNNKVNVMYLEEN